MFNATFSCPDLDTSARLDALGLSVTGQLIDDDRAVLACRVVEPDEWCRRLDVPADQRADYERVATLLVENINAAVTAVESSGQRPRRVRPRLPTVRV